jgi:hypothetical protein
VKDRSLKSGAALVGYDIDAYYGSEGSEISSVETIKAAFKEAHQWCMDNGYGCDLLLQLGSIDCGLSQQYFQEAIGRQIDPKTMGIWLPDEVRQLAAQARWPDPDSIPVANRGYYWTARKFLEVCVEHGLGVWLA